MKKTPAKKKGKKTPVKKKVRKCLEQRVIDLFRNEIKSRARAEGTGNISQWLMIKFHVKEIAKKMQLSVDDAVALCNKLYNKGVLRFAGDMSIPESEWHWKFKEWTVTTWDEGLGGPRHLGM